MGSSTYFGASHLTFREIPTQGKMIKYEVINNRFQEVIGVIHWRGGWRQYIFQAEPKIDMSRSCQKEIIKFIDELMDKWKINSSK